MVTKYRIFKSRRSIGTGTGDDISIIKKILPNSMIYEVKGNSKHIEYMDVNIFVGSDVYPQFILSARINIWIPNHECMITNVLKEEIEFMYGIHIIIAKTKKMKDVAKRMKEGYTLGYQIMYTKFTSLTHGLMWSSRVKDKNWNIILHDAGSYPWKQTEMVINTWMKYHESLPPIIITCKDLCLENIMDRSHEYFIKGCPKIKLYNQHDEYNRIKSEIGIQLCPSLVEGYGHTINKARYVGSVIITTDWVSHNELVDKDSAIMIPCDGYSSMNNESILCTVNTDSIYRAVMKALRMSSKERHRLMKNAHDRFMRDTKFFIKKMHKLIAMVSD